jgi:hypothetical protein
MNELKKLNNKNKDADHADRVMTEEELKEKTTEEGCVLHKTLETNSLVIDQLETRKAFLKQGLTQRNSYDNAIKREKIIIGDNEEKQLEAMLRKLTNMMKGIPKRTENFELDPAQQVTAALLAFQIFLQSNVNDEGRFVEYDPETQRKFTVHIKQKLKKQKGKENPTSPKLTFNPRTDKIIMGPVRTMIYCAPTGTGKTVVSAIAALSAVADPNNWRFLKENFREVYKESYTPTIIESSGVTQYPNMDDAVLVRGSVIQIPTELMAQWLAVIESIIPAYQRMYPHYHFMICGLPKTQSTATKKKETKIKISDTPKTNFNNSHRDKIKDDVLEENANITKKEITKEVNERLNKMWKELNKEQRKQYERDNVEAKIFQHQGDACAPPPGSTNVTYQRNMSLLEAGKKSIKEPHTIIIWFLPLDNQDALNGGRDYVNESSSSSSNDDDNNHNVVLPFLVCDELPHPKGTHNTDVPNPILSRLLVQATPYIDPKKNNHPLTKALCDPLSKRAAILPEFIYKLLFEEAAKTMPSGINKFDIKCTERSLAHMMNMGNKDDGDVNATSVTALLARVLKFRDWMQPSTPRRVLPLSNIMPLLDACLATFKSYLTPVSYTAKEGVLKKLHKQWEAEHKKLSGSIIMPSDILALVNSIHGILRELISGIEWEHIPQAIRIENSSSTRRHAVNPKFARQEACKTNLNTAFKNIQRLQNKLKEMTASYSGGKQDECECAICCEPMSSETFLIMTCCTNGIHQRCLKESLKTNHSCPFCRAPITGGQFTMPSVTEHAAKKQKVEKKKTATTANATAAHTDQEEEETRSSPRNPDDALEKFIYEAFRNNSLGRTATAIKLLTEIFNLFGKEEEGVAGARVLFYFNQKPDESIRTTERQRNENYKSRVTKVSEMFNESGFRIGQDTKNLSNSTAQVLHRTNTKPCMEWFKSEKPEDLYANRLLYADGAGDSGSIAGLDFPNITHIIQYGEGNGINNKQLLGRLTRRGGRRERSDGKEVKVTVIKLIN